MRRLFLVLCVALVACIPKPVTASPPVRPTLPRFALHSGNLIAPDTLVTSYLCSSGGTNTGCLFSGTATGGTLVAASSVPVSATPIEVRVICAAPGTVTLNGSLVGTAPGLPNSTAVAFAQLTGTCPVHAATPPLQPSFTLFVPKLGGAP